MSGSSRKIGAERSGKYLCKYLPLCFACKYLHKYLAAAFWRLEERDGKISKVNIDGFVWLEDIVEKLWRKHRVEESEVEQVFGNSPHFRFVEKGFREGENVYAALGQTDGGRYLIVFFVYKQSRQALVVSARTMTASERKLYERS